MACTAWMTSHFQIVFSGRSAYLKKDILVLWIAPQSENVLIGLKAVLATLEARFDEWRGRPLIPCTLTVPRSLILLLVAMLCAANVVFILIFTLCGVYASAGSTNVVCDPSFKWVRIQQIGSGIT
jgi:hypothetical protein